MEKPTLIFDFDSTLIRVESLEVILAKKLHEKPSLVHQIEAITTLGMEGEISFKDSLEQRLEIAAPTRTDLELFGKKSIEYITEGMQNLLYWANKRFDVWILSGGLYESITPFSEYFGIKNVHAVKLKWNSDGSFMSIDSNDYFSSSKLDGAKHISNLWNENSIIVGDGYTDYQLYKEGLVKHFVAFTKNIRRSFISSEMNEAKNSTELKSILENICN